MEATSSQILPEQQAVLSACEALIATMARLAVAHGLPYVDLDEKLRKAFVDAARQVHQDLPSHRQVSRISTMTGLNRREVNRLSQTGQTTIPRHRWPAGDLFTRWLSDPDLDVTQKRRLPRQGKAPSFDALAQSITRDVHPRSLLDELCRLGLVRLDETDDTVVVQRDAFVPKGDLVRMVDFLRDNVCDHLNAAVENVLGDGSQHFEQAIFADGLSENSVGLLRKRITAQWKALFSQIVPFLQEREKIDQDSPGQRYRIRLGLYSFDEAIPAPNPCRGKPEFHHAMGNHDLAYDCPLDFYKE